MALLRLFEVDDYSIILSFQAIVKVAAITNDKFSLSLNDTLVGSPFQPIDINNDYDVISRRLRLNFTPGILLPGATYHFIIQGLVDASNAVLPTETRSFETTATLPPPLVTPPPDTFPIDIQDQSVRSNAFVNSSTILSRFNPDFTVVDSAPEDQDLLIPGDFNNGRVTIRFNVRPAGGFVSPTYFKVQKKFIQRGPNRWIDVPVLVTLDSSDALVYVDFPSAGDATPVYNTSGHTYFEDGYKYRLKISRQVGT